MTNKTTEVRAEVNWNEVHPTVRQAMADAKVTGVHGTVTSASKNSRVEVTFSFDNDANECDHKFWFDADQVKMSAASKNGKVEVNF